MHSIERYGIVALLFLVVTVVAVLLWDGEKKGAAEGKTALGVPALRPLEVKEQANPPLPRPEAPSDEEARLTLFADARPGPLQRSPSATPVFPAASAATEEQLAAEEQAPAELAAGPGSAEEAEAPGRPLTAGAADAVAQPKRVAPPAAKTGQAYVVRPGDTLSEIAARQLGSARRWQEIVAANPGLDPAKLRVGKEIRLPGSAPVASAPGASAAGGAVPATGAAAVPAAAAQRKAESATWKVGRGESLWKIAERALGDGKRWREIAALNPAIDPDRLEPGVVLKLPAGGKSSAGSAPGRKAAPKKEAALLVASSSAPAARRGGKVK